MVKIVIIGAGSVKFCQKLVTDILSYPELSDSTICLMDTNKERLTLMTSLVERLVNQENIKANIESTLNRREALMDADYVIVLIRVGGLDVYELDIKIPEKYGVKQCIGDTLGPGGIFRGLRTVPVLLDICKDVEQICPRALVLNYVNPMAINCWAISRVSRVKVIGLCHSVQSTAEQLASYMQVSYDEISYWVAGINHMAWFLELKWKGKDAYPILRDKMDDPHLWDRVIGGYRELRMKDFVRFEIFSQTGYFVTESSFHMSEYVPYFRRTDELIEQYAVSTGLGLQIDTRTTRQMYKVVKRYIASQEPIPKIRSEEYAPQIIHSMETGEARLVYANVKNTGLIENLPQGCCVEVPCLVDREGIHPCHIGNLPSQCAALNRTNINVQELTVEAILNGNKEAVYQAIALDPLTSSLLTLRKVKAMANELLDAQKKYLPDWK